MARRCAAILAVVSCLAASGAHAQYQEYPDAAPPLYPEIIVPTDTSFSDDPELTGFRRAVYEASRALVKTELGEAYDPTAMLPYLDQHVDVFFGGAAEDQEFRLRGTFAPLDALSIVGSAVRRDMASTDPIVNQRYGMQEVGRQVLEASVGRAPWLDGRICTASYGRISDAEWAALRDKTGIHRSDWVIAVDPRSFEGDFGDDEADAVWPKRYQIVPIGGGQKRSGGWTGILTPDGYTRHYRTWFGDDAGYFASYLNSHICFARRGNDWKINAIAARLD